MINPLKMPSDCLIKNDEKVCRGVRVALKIKRRPHSAKISMKKKVIKSKDLSVFLAL